MKVFRFKYERHPRKKVLNEMKRALRTGIVNVRENEMICDSMASMLKLMSKSRFEVFAAIIEHRPESLNGLAHALRKDPGNVLKDAKVLEGLGLIRLVPFKGHRERLKPEALFDKIVFEFQPKATEIG